MNYMYCYLLLSYMYVTGPSLTTQGVHSLSQVFCCLVSVSVCTGVLNLCLKNSYDQFDIDIIIIDINIILWSVNEHFDLGRGATHTAVYLILKL